MLIVTTPAESYNLTTVEAVNAELSLDAADNSAQTSLIEQASSAIADYCGRVFAVETVEQTTDIDRATGVLLLERYPVRSVASIVFDGETLTTDDYEIDRARGLLYRRHNGKRAHWHCGRIVITYTGGFILPGNEGRNLPHRVERAAIELVKSMWFARTRDPLIRQEEITGIEVMTYSTIATSDALPSNVVGLLEGLRVAEFA
jgi:uncharacterized phiE125 gp8 family phage protein